MCSSSVVKKVKRMSLYKNKGVKIHPGRGTPTTIDFDTQWNDEESSESEDTPEQSSGPVSQPVSSATRKLRVREPTKREIATMSQLYGDKLSETEIREKIKRKLEIEAMQNQEDPTVSVANPVKHISSDDTPKSPLMQQWNPHAYRNQKAISSEQLFDEERRVGFRATLKRDIISLAEDLFTEEH
jgi:protein required for attachment to host cells